MQDYIPRTIDINSNIERFSIKQYDNNSRKIYFSLIDKDNPHERIINLENHTVRAYFRLPDETCEYIDGEVTDSDEGIIAVTLPSSVTQQVGSVQCEVGVSCSDDNSFLSLRVFSFDVIESIRDDEAIEAAPQFSALQSALNTVDGLSARMDNIVAMADSGEIEAGTIESEVIDARGEYATLSAAITAAAKSSDTSELETQITQNAENITALTEAAAATDTQLEENTESITTLTDLVTTKSPNLLNPDAMVNKSIDASGNVVNNSTTIALLDIPITAGQSLVCQGLASKYDSWTCWVYDSSGNVLEVFKLLNYDSDYSADFTTGSFSGSFTNLYTACENAASVSIYAVLAGYNKGSNHQLEYGTVPTDYQPYGQLNFKYSDEIEQIEQKQDKLTAGYGISISDGNEIVCTVSGGSDNIPYSVESKLASGSYSELAEIENPTELDFVTDGEINDSARPFFGEHQLIVSNTYFVQSADKSYDSSSKGGTLPIAFEFDGDCFEIGHRGLASFRFKVNEGSGWKYLSETALSVETTNGSKSYTQVKFSYAKPRKIIIETHQFAWCLRYNSIYQAAPLCENLPIAIFAGSSITEGSASGEFPMASYAAVCCREMGWECINLGVGARGIIKASSSGRYSVKEAVTDITQFSDAKYLFLGGSINDSTDSADDGTLAAGAEEIIDTVRAALPNIEIIVLGTFSPRRLLASDSSSLKVTNEAVKSAALAKQCFFMDMINAEVIDKDGSIIQTETPWITGTFSSTSADDMATVGNCQRIFTHERGDIDHTHPGRAGHEYIGRRLAASCRAMGLE